MKKRPPGLLRPTEDPDVVMMIGTAGHVDHGKTRLVKLLTGCTTDRLKVEQERGLTIELGFAPCVLGGGLCVGIVDVPGHEKFIKNMVAGVSGIALTVLVIAADDGVMPQTIEHLEIMSLMGVEHGIVALTKTDLVDPGRVEEASASIAAFLKGTFMEGAGIFPLSSETGDGVFTFYDALVAEINSLSSARREGVFRMPIERTFTQKGFGTVVTGIPVAGSIAVGDQVELVPGGKTGRIRGIQRFLRDAKEGGYGQCLALNIAESGKEPAQRGQVVCAPGHLGPATCFHVSLQSVSRIDPPLRHNEQVKFHTGTSETPAKLFLLEDRVLPGGKHCHGSVVTEHPVAAAVGDRFILRRPSPAATVGGGVIVAITKGTLRPRKKELVHLFELRDEVLAAMDPGGETAKAVNLWLRLDEPHGAEAGQIARGALLTRDEADTALRELKTDGLIRELGTGHYIHSACYAEAVAEAEGRVRRAREEERALSLTLTELQKGLDWPQSLWHAVLADLEAKKSVRVRGAKVLLGGASAKLGAKDQLLMESILRIYEDGAFQSPRPDELPDLLKAPPAKSDMLVGYLCDEGQLVRLNKNVILGYANLKEAQDIVIRVIKAEGELDSADFKRHIRSSRKYALAILDYFDARRITVRADNRRKLAANHEDRLL